MLTVLIAAATAPAKAQDPRISARFPAAAAARLDVVIDSAGREGLPTDPLVLRALEGQAKNVPLDRIVDALGRLRDALHAARVTLGPSAAATELTTAAAALEAGVPDARLAELRQLRSGQSLTAPLAAYLDLIASGVSASQAWSRIADLARHRATDADFVQLTPTDIQRGRDHPPGPATSGGSR
ncbi:MAG TPA: hypothetical protein VGL65_04145 [Gemmatimonadales bacterium]